jgi:hypothetical protein
LLSRPVGENIDAHCATIGIFDKFEVFVVKFLSFEIFGVIIILIEEMDILVKSWQRSLLNPFR